MSTNCWIWVSTEDNVTIRWGDALCINQRDRPQSKGIRSGLATGGSFATGLEVREL